MSIPPSKMVTYSYDSQGRLVSAVFPNGAQATYSYDAMGNRTTVMEVPATTPTDCCPPTVAAFPKSHPGNFDNAAMLVMLSNGQIAGWGDSNTGVLANGLAAAVYGAKQEVLFNPNTTMPPSTATVVDWAITNANLYVVFSNGWCYSSGQNTYGQLALGDTTNRSYLTRIEYFVTNSKSITNVWAGGCFSSAGVYGGGNVFFQASDYSMFAAGLNAVGQLGNGNTTNQTSPVACNLGGASGHVIDVATSACGGNMSTYFLMSNNGLLVAGYNVQGQLGTGTNTNVTTGFVSAKEGTGSGTNVNNFVSICAHGAYDGTNFGGNALAIDTSGNVWTTGYNTYGTLGIGVTTAKNLFTQTSLTNIVKAQIGGPTGGYGYAINNTGTMYVWGYNGGNNLFLNTTASPQSTPVVASHLPAGSVQRVLFPRGDTIGTSTQLIVLMTNSVLAYAGAANGQVGINSIADPGAYSYVPTPREFLDGTDTISDVFVHGAGTAQRWFIISASGLLYATGNNTGSICNSALATNINQSNACWTKISFAK